jgi:hypothetical protein
MQSTYCAICSLGCTGRRGIILVSSDALPSYIPCGPYSAAMCKLQTRCGGVIDLEANWQSSGMKARDE